MNPSTSLGTRSNVGMAKPSPPVRQAGNIGRLLVIHGVCRRSVPSACPQVKYRCRCRVIGFQGRGCAEVIQPNGCHSFLLEALLFQWLSTERCASRTMMELKTPESNKSA